MSIISCLALLVQGNEHLDCEALILLMVGE